MHDYPETFRRIVKLEHFLGICSEIVDVGFTFFSQNFYDYFTNNTIKIILFGVPTQNICILDDSLSHKTSLKYINFTSISFITFRIFYTCHPKLSPAIKPSSKKTK